MLGWHSIFSLFGRKNPCALAKRLHAASPHKKFIWWQHCIRGYGLQPKTLHVHRLSSQGEIQRRRHKSTKRGNDSNRAETKRPNHMWSSWEWHDRIYLCADSGINCWSCLTQEQLGRAVFARRMLWRVISHCCFLSCLMLSTIFCLCNFIVLFFRLADCKLMLFHLSTNAQAAARFQKCWWFITYLRNNTYT